MDALVGRIAQALFGPILPTISVGYGYWAEPSVNGYMKIYMRSACTLLSESLDLDLGRYTPEMYLSWLSDANIHELWRRFELLRDERITVTMRRDILRRMLLNGKIPHRIDANMVASAYDTDLPALMERLQIPYLKDMDEIIRAGLLFDTATGSRNFLGKMMDETNDHVDRDLAERRLGILCLLDRRIVAGLGYCFGCPNDTAALVHLAFAPSDRIDLLLAHTCGMVGLQQYAGMRPRQHTELLRTYLGYRPIPEHLPPWKQYLFVFSQMPQYVMGTSSDIEVQIRPGQMLRRIQQEFDNLTDEQLLIAFPGSSAMPRSWLKLTMSRKGGPYLFLYPVRGVWTICVGQLEYNRFVAYEGDVVDELRSENLTNRTVQILYEDLRRYAALQCFLELPHDPKLMRVLERIRALAE